MAYPSDALMTKAQAQVILDTTDEDELARVVSGVSAKCRAFLNRTRLTEGAVTEYLRPENKTNVLFLHASPVDTAAAVEINVYMSGAVANTYTLAAGDLMVTADDLHTRVDLLTGGTFPCTEGAAVGGANFIKVEYTGGWVTVPGDVYAGAIMQARIDLKRMRGEVGFTNRSAKGDSVSMDSAGVVATVADMWRPYRVMI